MQIRVHKRSKHTAKLASPTHVHCGVYRCRIVKQTSVVLAKPLLVLGWGNPSRGDDALGPLCVAKLQARCPQELAKAVDFQEDFQLNVEHALDLRGRRQVLFIDASFSAKAPFEICWPQASMDASYSTHALSPQSVLHVYQLVEGVAAPAATLLAIRGECFELGAPLSAHALGHLEAALNWALGWLTEQQRVLQASTMAEADSRSELAPPGTCAIRAHSAADDAARDL